VPVVAKVLFILLLLGEGRLYFYEEDRSKDETIE